MKTHKSIYTDLTVASLYHFANMRDLELKRSSLRSICEEQNILGTILLATEGINGTITGEYDCIEIVIDAIRGWDEISDLEVKYSTSTHENFNRMKVKIKDEIVTMEVGSIDVSEQSGQYVEPKDWDEFIRREDVIVIDVRNNYETSIGKFANSVDPDTDSFKQFPAWADEFYSRNTDTSNTKIAMYCTGGIRCEKATSYMKELGFEEVYHLKGGILKYLEEVTSQDILWEGECFVFDDRVSLKHGLSEGSYSLCYSCQEPVSQEGKTSPMYEEGVSCPSCHNNTSEDRLMRSRERQKQILLSKERGEKHIGQRFD